MCLGRAAQLDPSPLLELPQQRFEVSLARFGEGVWVLLSEVRPKLVGGRGLGGGVEGLQDHAGGHGGVYAEIRCGLGFS